MSGESSCDGLVMVVEDDADIREAITEILQDNEYASVAAANGREAIERLRAQSTRPCLILLDLMMPEMDGWEFRALQRRDSELSAIPVVVLTAHTNLPHVMKVLQVAACLEKPVSIDTLLTTVEHFCRRN
jgi:CheY-like chemotaxis protein